MTLHCNLGECLTMQCNRAIVHADAVTDIVVIPSAFSAQLHQMLPHVEGKKGAQPQQLQRLATIKCSLLASGCLVLTASLRILSQNNKALQNENRGLP